MVEETKKCRTCGEVKQKSLLKKSKSCKDGYTFMCLSCRSEYDRMRCKDYYSRNKDTILKKQKDYRESADGKKLQAVYTRRYHEKNKERLLPKSRVARRKYYQEHIEYERKRNKDYYELETVKEKKRNRERANAAIISDVYVIHLMRKRGTIVNPTPEIIGLKRDQIKLHRAIKEAQNGITGTRDKRTSDNEQADNCRDDNPCRG